jgi:hypothetical protein
VTQDHLNVLGRYRITGEIGRGMMGVVYRAVDPALGRTVALKTVSARLASSEEDRADFEARFMTEARAAALLSHPAIVTVHDLGRDEVTDTLYIALEYIEGRTLADVVRDQGPLTWRQALAIAGRIAGALDHAHQRGIVHRDVKPANIMLLASGEAKLTDFGIAKIDAADLTAPGDFLGTPSYMSPEQASGNPLDGRSDIFSLGGVLYFMITGRRAFDAPTVPGIMARIVHEPAAPIDPRDLPPDAEYIVDRCLAKAPAARYPRARQMEEDVEDVLAGRPPRHRPEWADPEQTIPTDPGAATAPALRGTAGDAVVEWVDRLGWRGFAAIGLGLVLLLVAAAALQPPGAEPVAAVEPSAAAPLPPVQAESVPAPSPVPGPARLDVSFRHPFRAATLKVWVDDDLVVEQQVAGRVIRDLLALKLRRGTYRTTVDVPPGERVVRIEVDDDDGFRSTRRIRGRFESEEKRTVIAIVDGLVRKDLTLGWGR